ncbi:DUF1570 domain-containing protein [Pedobacter changchengzhani]|uniref:DUF1570 domain-containing protein n=1 Tax=Pedobacter changchengzhani TaxID=2529274 RepID=A0A4R5MIM3_9SPHI|nr:DUF1570 domain-containing protein [Pedobacter changchengzhani]TDG35226.1 DUF1570 domain-containing protein [Pedobacter changchengzhani]
MSKLIVIIFILFTTHAFGQALTIRPINCVIKESDNKKIARLLNYERMFYNEIFDTDINFDVPITLNIYGKIKDFKALKQQYEILKSADGFYASNVNEAFLFKSSDYISISLHEVSHGLMQSNFKNPPRWLNEGMAEFFETFDFDENGDLYSSPQQRIIQNIKTGIELKEKNRLQTFFSLNANNFYTEGIADNYSTAYSVIYFLVKTKNSAALTNIVKLIKQGKTSEDAISTTFGSFKNFEDGYKRFYYYVK